MNYEELVMDAMRGVVREALRRVSREGLIGEHHFYLSFRTGAPGVEIPAQLCARYPDEMTIVIQHQFWDLIVGEEAFSITLAFGGIKEPLVIPFQSLTSFLDPSVPFGLEFHGSDDDDALVDVEERDDDEEFEDEDELEADGLDDAPLLRFERAPTPAAVAPTPTFAPAPAVSPAPASFPASARSEDGAGPDESESKAPKSDEDGDGEDGDGGGGGGTVVRLDRFRR